MTDAGLIEPFTYFESYSKKATSASSNFQLCRMPWPSPTSKPGRLVEVAITNTMGVAGILQIWDQDLSNTTPPTRGSAGDGIYTLEIAASAASGVAAKTTLYAIDQLPDHEFVGGIAFQSNVIDATLTGKVGFY